MAYAAETKVSVESSRVEIEKTLKRYKAEGFYYAHEHTRALIAFRIKGRMIRFILNLPAKDDEAFTHYMRGYTKVPRAPGPAAEKWEQACRQKWRALALVIKAKLEAVDAGITTIEDEFLAHTLLPDGKTVGETAGPQIDEAYRLGLFAPPLRLESR